MAGVVNFTGSSCVLACIESFLEEQGCDISQEEMIRILPQSICSPEGIIWDMPKACELIGLHYSKIPTSFSLPHHDSNETIFITTEKSFNGVKDGSGRHCVRFLENLDNEEKIIVMDPNFVGHDHERYMDKIEFLSRECVLHKIAFYSTRLKC